MTPEVNLNMNKMPIAEDPVQHIQTGYDQYDVRVVRFRSQSANGLSNLFIMPSKRTHFDNIADLKAASPSSFFKTHDDANYHFVEVLLDLGCARRTYIRASMKGVVQDLTLSGSLFYGLYPWVEAGLLRQRPPQKGLNATNGSDQTAQIEGSDSLLEDLFEGIQHKGVGTDTSENHEHVFRRLLYIIGVYWSKTIPKRYLRPEQQNSTVWYLIVMNYLCAGVKAIEDLIFGGAVASDKGVFNIGFLIENMINSHVDRSMGSAVDSKWKDIAKVSKHNEISTNITNHTQYTSDFINLSLINSATLDDYVKEYSTVYTISDLGLKLARQMFGVGRFDKNHEVKHFMFLIDLFYESTGGLYDGHGVTCWAVGGNLAVALAYYQDSRTEKNEWEDMLINQRSYAYDEIKSWAEKIYVQWSIKTDFQGIAEPSVYRAMVGQWGFSDTNYNGSSMVSAVARKPQDLISAHVLLTGVANLKPGWFASLFWLNGHIPERYRLFFPTDWDMQELIMAIRFSALFMTAGTITSWSNNYRYVVSYIHLIDVTKTKNDEVWGQMYATVETVRMEALKDPATSTAFPNVKLKYTACLLDVTSALTLTYSAPRPRGLDGTVSNYIDKIGNHETLMALAESCLTPSGSSKVDNTPQTSSGSPKLHTDAPKKVEPPGVKPPKPETEDGDD